MDKHEPVYLKDYSPSEYLIDQVELTFHLEEEKTRVQSILHIKQNPKAHKKTGTLVLNGDELKLLSVSLNKKSLKETEYKLTPNSLSIPHVPEQFTVEIETLISPNHNTTLEGLYVSNHNFCTQCEPEGFRRITFFIDRPDVMSCYTTTIIADEKKYPILLSNGNLTESKKLGDGKVAVKWVDPFKKPSYLFALVAGDFEKLEEKIKTPGGRHVTLQIYVEKGNLDKAPHAMQSLKKVIIWDFQSYGRDYDLDLYMIVAVSDFTAGAMENKGLNIFNSKYILAKADTATDDDFMGVESVIAHEYCHNWTGNRITCRDWFQLSLKEGLTIFREQHFTEDTTSKTVARIREVAGLRVFQFPEDAGPLAHPVRPDSYLEINNFFTTTIYNKGAEVIRIIRTILGKELFRKGMDLYFERHDGQAVTIEDFVQAMSDASKVDLRQVFLWYTQAGTPLVEITEHYDGKKYALTFKQSCPTTPDKVEKKAMHIPIAMGLLNPSGKEIYQGIVQLKKREETLEFPHMAEKPIPSFLREFSAPIKLNFNYTNEQLLFLFKNDTDGFDRWESIQKYVINLILKMVENPNTAVPNEYIDALRWVLQHEKKDLLFLSEVLTLPSSKYLGDQMKIVEVDRIFSAREKLRLEISTKLKPLLLELYHQHHLDKWHFSLEEVGKRRLKNTCLAYLMLLTDKEIYNIGLKQFHQSLSNNMTDALSTLIAFANTDSPEREIVLKQFYDYWQKDPLVICKWFSAQGSSKLPDALSRVKTLLNHPAFDIKNPNKVYALIGGFCQQNFIQFHNPSGAGYTFTADQVIRLDKINSRVAANLAISLTSWKRFDPNRSALMHKELERISKIKDLSVNTYEIVSKSL